MRSCVIVFSLLVIASVNCVGVEDRKFDHDDGFNPFIIGINFDYPKKSQKPKKHIAPYRAQYHPYGRGSPIVYGAPRHRPIRRPRTQLAPPLTAYPSPSVSGYSPDTFRHPPPTVATHSYHPPYISPYSAKAPPPRYALSPVRQYIPHHYPRYSPDVAIPPKMIQLQSTSYATATPSPYSPLPHLHYNPQAWRENENVYDSDEIEYYNQQHGSLEDEGSEDSGSDEIDIGRKGKVQAEERRDGPSEVNALVSPYHAAGEEHKGEKHYSKKSGAEYGDEHKSKKGYKASKGHSSEHKFAKGEKGHHDKEVHKKDYEEEGEKEKDHHDEESKQGSNHDEDHGEKKGEFAEKKKHRKGSKTKGYHNVFHKDEYVKDHTFYDDLDQSGHYKKHEEEHHGHKKESAKHKEGEHHDSAKKQEKKGHKGKYSKGHHDDADSGHDKKRGHEQHYEILHDYKKKGGEAEKHQHGHSKGY